MKMYRELPEDKPHYYVVRASYTWGRGLTLTEALKKAKVTRLKDLEHVTIYVTSDPEGFIDALGNMMWRSNYGCVRL